MDTVQWLQEQREMARVLAWECEGKAAACWTRANGEGCEHWHAMAADAWRHYGRMTDCLDAIALCGGIPEVA